MIIIDATGTGIVTIIDETVTEIGTGNQGLKIKIGLPVEEEVQNILTKKTVRIMNIKVSVAKTKICKYPYVPPRKRVPVAQW